MLHGRSESKLNNVKIILLKQGTECLSNQNSGYRYFLEVRRGTHSAVFHVSFFRPFIVLTTIEHLLS